MKPAKMRSQLLVPRMYKSEFDDRATETLQSTVRKHLKTNGGLQLKRSRRNKLIWQFRVPLSEDLSTLVRCALPMDFVEIFDPAAVEYREVYVKCRNHDH